MQSRGRILNIDRPHKRPRKGSYGGSAAAPSFKPADAPWMTLLVVSEFYLAKTEHRIPPRLLDNMRHRPAHVTDRPE